MVTSIGKYMGLQFDEEIFTYLTEDYGGHPFLIRQVCSYLYRNAPHQRPFTISKFRYKSQKIELSRNVGNYINLILGVLKNWYPFEYELLKCLAVGNTDTFNEYANVLHDTIEHLEGYGIITQEHGNYYFKIKALEDYLKSISQLDVKQSLERAGKWQEVTLRRNDLEINLRKIVQFVLVTHFGAAKAKDIFLEVIEERRRNKLSLLNFSEVFSSPSTEIYFDDLRKITIKHWDKFSNLFGNDKERFNIYMQYINKYRIDAHAKEIDEDDFATLRTFFSWFERHISNLPSIS